MDVLTRILLGVAMCLFLKVMVSAKHATSPSPRPSLMMLDEKYLRMMLLTLMEQNRRLVLKNKQLQQVWPEMQEMCKFFTKSACACDATQVYSSDITAPYTYTNTVKQSSQPEEPELPMQILTVKSSGSSGNMTSISVTYIATPNHTTEWVGLRGNGGVWRTGGTKEEVIRERKMCTCTVYVEDLDDMKEILFFLYNEEVSVNIGFNVTEIQTKQEQNVSPPAARLLGVISSYMAPIVGDLIISAVVDENVSAFSGLSSFEVYFTGVNGSSSKIFEIFSFNSDVIRVNWSYKSETTSNLFINIKQPYVQYGGILTLRFWQPMTGMLKDLYHGPLIKILAPDVNDIVRYNTLGVFPLAMHTVIYQPTSSLMCAAMGNPRPNVSVLKIINGHNTKEIPTETVVSDNYMNMKILTLAWNQSLNIEGVYICRASNGNQTIDSHTEIIVFDSVVFNETNTGVEQNDSKIIVLSCMAHGKPKPELSLRLYGDYGPSLIDAGIYKVWTENMFSSRITLTILTSDGPDLHTVYCLASQGGQNRISRKIELYPGVEQGYNWDLYERLEKSSLFK